MNEKRRRREAVMERPETGESAGVLRTPAAIRA
jgi:hypothetical protein